MLVSSASGPYPSAGSNANESCRKNIARYKAPEYVGFVEEYQMIASGRSGNTSCERPPPNDRTWRPPGSA